jgi:hypothetical protein
VATPACPHCGQPIRSAKGCACGGVAPAGTKWEVPALEAAIERRFRMFAIPVALVVAWGAVHAGFLHMLLRTVLSMWIHELGHAASAWLCGRFAVPGPWFTPVGAERSWLVVLLVAAALLFGAFRLWHGRKPWAVVLLLLLLPVQLYCAFGLSGPKADAFIIWSGDGGCMVIGTLLMLSLYARKHSQIRVGWLRWGFLVIGAAAFADGFATWWAARGDHDAIPFGENEGRGPSDPTVLVFQHGFSMSGLVQSYVWTGIACLVVLAVAYVLGLRRERAGTVEDAA